MIINCVCDVHYVQVGICIECFSAIIDTKKSKSYTLWMQIKQKVLGLEA
jgi:hypothetical protein